jgi:NAD(P)H-nitrite reductase large subunit
VEKADEANGRYISLQFAGDVLVGATSVGLTEHVGALRGLIQSKTKLGAWKQTLLQTPTRFAEAYIACQRPNS